MRFPSALRIDKATGATIIVGALGIFATYHIAIRQGSLDKSAIEVGFDGIDFSKDSDTHIFIAVNKSISNNDLIFLPVSLSLKNTGDKLIDDALLSFKYEKGAQYDAMNVSQYMGPPHGSLLSENVSHESNSTPEADYSNFHLKKFNVRTTIAVEDGVVAYKNSENFLVPFLSNLGADINASLEGTNIARRDYRLNYAAIALDNEQQLINWYANYYAKYIAIRTRESTTFFPYLFKLIFSREKVAAYLAAPEYTSAKGADRTAWIPKSFPKEFKGAEFSPYSWSLLFYP